MPSGSSSRCRRSGVIATGDTSRRLGDTVAATSLSLYIADTIKKPSNLTLGLCEIEQNQVGGLGQPATVSDRPEAAGRRASVNACSAAGCRHSHSAIHHPRADAGLEDRRLLEPLVRLWAPTSQLQNGHRADRRDVGKASS